MAILTYFGTPGAGKTTHASMIVKRNLKKGIRTYSNVPIHGAFKLDPFEDLGIYNVCNCDIILDEASIFANNRKFANKGKAGIPQSFIEFLKLHRHFKVRNIYVYSQAPDDMDITLRRLSTSFYLLKKSIIPQFSYSRRIARLIGQIDPITHQITDGYRYVPFSRKYIFRPRYYKMFDSWDTPPLPEKEFETY